MFLYRLLSLYNLFVKIILNFYSKDATRRIIEPDFNKIYKKVLNREYR